MLHFTELNPHIDLRGTRLAVGTALAPWPAGEAPRFAGVSAFGFGGTNAHVVLEEAPRLPAPPPGEGPFLLPVSARSEEALADAARRMQAALHDLPAGDAGGVALAALCATAAKRRTHHDHRGAVVGAGAGELIERLGLLTGGASAPGVARGRRRSGARRRLAFVFTGQGPQWWGMGRELLDTNVVFRAVVDEVRPAAARARRLVASRRAAPRRGHLAVRRDRVSRSRRSSRCRSAWPRRGGRGA